MNGRGPEFESNNIIFTILGIRILKFFIQSSRYNLTMNAHLSRKPSKAIFNFLISDYLSLENN